ncbi:hypothetical protein ASPBRDRAFT_624195 [Aspergillus brasiliensis CBS 101740]|uniref:Secreted protein n=1 Tax=Aspergillus brasiliensis (strain CBS 101740 / IMI 381727 / IBT 21946) TaxID=767769 RepID=A0A1L9UFV6_ASPBC|nr:hypothetical protein ASPBRDRAFT_624195 [Aspergillus brasiliensis CBS 101740]
MPVRLADHIVLWYVPCWLTSSANASGLHVGCGDSQVPRGRGYLRVQMLVSVAVSIAKQPPSPHQPAAPGGVLPLRPPPMMSANINPNCILSIQFGGYLAFLSIGRYPPAPLQFGGYG